MTVRKFLAIYDRVAKHIPVSYDAELRFEHPTTRPRGGFVQRFRPSVAAVLMRFPVSRSFLNRLFASSDFLHCVFQPQAIELIDWQVAKQINSPIELLSYLPKVFIG
jgi:hypothetical protein